MKIICFGNLLYFYFICKSVQGSLIVVKYYFFMYKNCFSCHVFLYTQSSCSLLIAFLTISVQTSSYTCSFIYVSHYVWLSKFSIHFLIFQPFPVQTWIEVTYRICHIVPSSVFIFYSDDVIEKKGKFLSRGEEIFA